MKVHEIISQVCADNNVNLHKNEDINRKAPCAVFFEISNERISGSGKRFARLKKVQLSYYCVKPEPELLEKILNELEDNQLHCTEWQEIVIEEVNDKTLHYYTEIEGIE